MNLNLEVYFKGKLELNLNKNLVETQKLSELDVDVLKALHCDRLRLFEKMTGTHDSKELKRLALEMKEIEFSMQEAWKFPRDEKKHSWWFQLPKCTCPKMDNRGRWGLGNFIINEECILHGK